MALVARPDEEVGLRVQALRQLAPGLGDLVDVLLRGRPCSSATRQTFVACSSTPGQEERLVAALPMMAREDVGRDRRVRVADVRLSFT